MKIDVTTHLKMGKNGYSHIIPKKKPIKVVGSVPICSVYRAI
jgi:hypothetical protein